MATSTNPRHSTEIRTQFSTKEGVYRNAKASEHCRPSRQPLFGKELSPVQISLVSCKAQDGVYEWIAFNSGKELYFYRFDGVGKVPDLKHPIDKRVYKAPTIPVCHDFNTMTRSTEHLDLVVGFSTGPLQYLNPLDKQAVTAFNEDGSVDSTRVTCVKWIPGSEHNFVSSHRSGNLYVWTTENHTSKVTSPPVYVSQKEILGAKIYTVRQKQKSALLACWTVGHGPINAFAFSPDAVHIAIASQDGFLRIYDYHKQAIYGRMRSYFGGLLCVCWSPDGKYTVTGGEDDLITVWSFEHKKVVARGEGHKSYVNAVAFDPYMTVLPSSNSPKELEKTEEMPPSSVQTQAEVSTGDGSEPESESRSAGIRRHLSVKSPASEEYTAYRLGSIGQDTQICLWDLSGDSLKIRRLIARGRSRMSRHSRPVSMVDTADTGTHSQPAKDLNPDTQQQPSSQEGQNSEEKAIDGDPSLVSNHFGHELNGAHLETNHLVSSDSDPLSELRVQLELDRRESSPSVSLSSTSSSASHKKAKKRKKDKNKEKNKDKPFKQQRNSLHKVMKFVGSGFSNSSPSHHNHGKRSVGTFESCNSDDIALKMHEVNLVEPLVAKKISLERLTALVFREDCILTACQEGFISTWARPNVCITSLESEEDANYPVADANVPTSNAGINSPKPGAHESPVKISSM